MGELARRRRARDLWISRGHLWAAGLGAAFLLVIAFSVGVMVGGSERAHAAPSDPLGLSQAPDDSLVELLARVDASADPTSGVASLTFPDALAGQEPATPKVPPTPHHAGVSVTVTARPMAKPEVDPVPDGHYTVAVLETPDSQRAEALRDQLAARDLPAWVGAEIVGGRSLFRVSLGGFATEGEAHAAAKRFAAADDDLPLVTSAYVQAIGAEVQGG